MLKYTKAAINKTISEFKLFSRIFKYSFIILNFVYLTYKLITDKTNFIIYLVLLCLFIIYATFSLLFDYDKRFKKAKKLSRRIFKYTNLTFKFLVIGSNILCIIKASSNFNAITIILLLLSTIIWVLQIIIEIIIFIFESKRDLLMDAIKEDFKVVSKPVTGVSNFIKKIKGEEITKEDNSSSIQKLENYLSKKIKSKRDKD